MNWKRATQSTFSHIISLTRLGLVSDVDGTLSPIVDDPKKAHLLPENKALLEKLTQSLTLVAALSGRQAEDIRHRVGIPGMAYIGNHGLEVYTGGSTKPSPDAAPFMDAVSEAYQAVKGMEKDGVIIEFKEITISIHYRQAANPDETHKDLAPRIQEIALRTGLELFEGKRVFELRPPIHINKGTAFELLVKEHALDAAFFLGDDTTDAPAFTAARELRRAGICQAYGIAVISEETPPEVRSACDYTASSVSDVTEFLSWLAKARTIS